MSSTTTVKGMMMMRSTTTTTDVYNQRLFKGKHASDHLELFKYSTSPSSSSSPPLVSRSSRAWLNPCQDSHPNPKRLELPLSSRARARAILTPVSDPTTPTTKKRVFYFGKGKSEGNKGMKSLVTISLL